MSYHNDEQFRNEQVLCSMGKKDGPDHDDFSEGSDADSTGPGDGSK